MFGTDGIRGRFDASLFSIEQLHKLGLAFGSWFCQIKKNPTLIIMSDTRQSGYYIKSALKSGILLYPVHIIDAGILPTPGASILLEHFNADGALIISASHNPAHDNGIKIITARGKLSAQEEAALIAHINQLSAPSFTLLGTESYCHDAEQIYTQSIIKHFNPHFLQNKRIVLDVAHGACSTVAPRIFKEFGAEVITINDQPNGNNINDNCGSTHPHTLQHAVQEYNAWCGFAFDGDGDRTIAVCNKGTIKDGDDILAILAQHPRYHKSSGIISTTMSNQGLEHFLQQRNTQLIRTSVGDKYVIEQLKKECLLLGGESSGHIIMYDRYATGDGIFTALTVLETLLFLNNNNFITFTRFPQFLHNIMIHHKMDLQQDPCAHVITQAQQEIYPGRIIIRYSGTEPILRIMTESLDEEKARHIGTRLAQELKTIFNY